MYEIQRINIWKKEAKTQDHNEYLEMDVADLGLSVRSFNCLKRASCNTVGDIIAIIESERGLLSIRNLGKNSQKEIIEKIEEIKKNTPKNGGGLRGTKKVLLEPAKKYWDKPIDEFELSALAKEDFRRCGVRRIKDLYAQCLVQEPGWFAVRELFEKI